MNLYCPNCAEPVTVRVDGVRDFKDECGHCCAPLLAVVNLDGSYDLEVDDNAIRDAAERAEATHE